MKILKIIGAVFSGTLALAFIATLSAGVDIPSVILAIIFSFFTAWLIYSLVKNKNTSDFGQIAKMKEEAEQYASGLKKEAEDAKSASDEYVKSQLQAFQKEKSSLEEEIKKLKWQISSLSSESVAKVSQVPVYRNIPSQEIKNRLSVLRTIQAEMIKSKHAVTVTDPELTSKEANSATKKILRCFNAECESIFGSVTLKNIDSSRDKISRAYETENSIFSDIGVAISQKFFESKLDELGLIYSYIQAEEEEKEQRKAIREQMVEEEKVRREIERQKQKIEKEEAQFSSEIKKLMGYMSKSKDDVEKQLYIDKIKELEEKLAALQKDKEDVLNREQNTRAGFVYIISNIGAFGEDVYKIGMTRRLDPMDRISELSSASVPFPFDVHAMIFSDDAPALETILHNYFDKARVNKVNPRKEFFKISLEEIKKVVLENHNSTVKFIDIPDATEYRETLKLLEK